MFYLLLCVGFIIVVDLCVWFLFVMCSIVCFLYNVNYIVARIRKLLPETSLQSRSA